MPFHGDSGKEQWVVVWSRLGTAPNGSPIVSNIPEEIECRLDDSTRTIQSPDGDAVVINATISGYTLQIPVGSAVWRGRIDEMPGTSQVPSRNVLEVVTSDRTWDFRGREEFCEATLKRWRDAMPTTGTPS